MEYYSGYKSSDLQEAMAKLANLTLKSMDINYKYRVCTQLNISLNHQIWVYNRIFKLL